MKKILIVEDDKMIADNLRQIVELLGYRALPEARSYDEALQLFDRHSPDLVTLDVQLKGEKTGIDMAHYIRTHGTVPFLFLTAQTGEGLMEKAVETNPSAYLTKPFTIAELKAVLDKVFESELNQRTVGPKLYDC
ncbi:MAG: response regulator [Roseivirga sp.]|nr:response regulator [Roseivirga sp.]